MRTKNELSRITIDIPAIDHKKLKAVDDLNKESLKRVKNIEQGKNLVQADSLEDLFKKLGI